MARPEWTIVLDAPEGTFETINGDFATAAIVGKVEGITDSVKNTPVADATLTYDMGRHTPAKGLIEGSVGFGTHLAGQAGSAQAGALPKAVHIVMSIGNEVARSAK